MCCCHLISKLCISHLLHKRCENHCYAQGVCDDNILNTTVLKCWGWICPHLSREIHFSNTKENKQSDRETLIIWNYCLNQNEALNRYQLLLLASRDRRIWRLKALQNASYCVRHYWSTSTSLELNALATVSNKHSRREPSVLELNQNVWQITYFRHCRVR